MNANRVTLDSQALLDISQPAWKQAPAQKLQLVQAPLVMQPSPWMQGAFKGQGQGWGGLTRADLQFLHNGDVLAARITWAVKQASKSSTGPDEFPDACALMFPFVRDASIFMGSDKAWVNMWLWRADGYGPFSVTAAGIGTTQRVNDGVVKAVAGYAGGSWQVVFTRPFKPADHRDHVPLQAGSTWQASLALWQGANAERGGLKSFCPTWTDVDIEA